MHPLEESVEAGLRNYFGKEAWSDAVFSNATKYVLDAIDDAGFSAFS